MNARLVSNTILQLSIKKQCSEVLPLSFWRRYRTPLLPRLHAALLTVLPAIRILNLAVSAQHIPLRWEVGEWRIVQVVTETWELRASTGENSRVWEWVR